VTALFLLALAVRKRCKIKKLYGTETYLYVRLINVLISINELPARNIGDDFRDKVDVIGG
jgi:hypothetical protein